jgi:hypothetical protein
MVKERIAGATVAALGIALVLPLFLAGCTTATYEVRYDVRVTEAVVETDVPEDGPGTQVIAVRTEWTVSSFALDVRFSNPADTAAVIMWEGATYSHGGETAPLVLTAPQAGPELPQPPTTIPRRGQVAVGLIPQSHGEWYAVEGLFGGAAGPEPTESDWQAVADAAIGQTFEVRIPIRTGGRSLTYMYDVRVLGATVRPSYH